MALADDYARGLIQKSTYIRLSIASPRHDQGDSYQIALPLAGVTLAEVLTEASLLARDEFLEIAIAPFTITWLQPELLPSFLPAAVQSMQVGGRGYLYFALGADNQGKTKTQQVDSIRLYSFYRMSRVDLLAELGRLLETKTATVDISNLSVRWLNKSAPAAREFGSIADVVTQLRKEINEAIALIPPSGVKSDEFLTAFNVLTDEIHERQMKGDYVTNARLTQILADLNQQINDLISILDNKQPIDNYILATDPRLSNARPPLAHTHQDLMQALALKQDVGEYAPLDEFNGALAKRDEVLAQLTNWIRDKQPIGDYALQQALTDAVTSLQAAINKKQAAGNYVSSDDARLTDARTPLTHTHEDLVQALAGKQPTGNYVMTSDTRLTDARTPLAHTHQDLLDRLTVIEAKQAFSPFTLGIDCGRVTLSNPIVDGTGNYFINDCYFSGGQAGNNGVSATTNTDVPLLYLNERYGTSTYTIPVAAGNYTVKLLFAENFNTAIGQRVFNVDLQGVRVLTNFDIFKDAGAGRKALIKTFSAIAANASKQIIVKVYDPGTIMAIQLVRES